MKTWYKKSIALGALVFAVGSSFGSPFPELASQGQPQALCVISGGDCDFDDNCCSNRCVQSHRGQPGICL
jgi:hypothetical protein